MRLYSQIAPAAPTRPRAVLVHFAVGALVAATSGCSAPAKEHPPGSAQSAPAAAAASPAPAVAPTGAASTSAACPDSRPAPTAASPAPSASTGQTWGVIGLRRPLGGGPCQPIYGRLPAPSNSASSAPAASSAPTEPPQASPTSESKPAGSSAYLGCGEPIPHERLWDETTEGEVLDAIGAAKACAAAHGRHLLLEFVAPWCKDCQEMARLDATSVVATTLEQRFERVRINVGEWDRHEGLRKTFDVHALATYVVLDPKTSRELAKTTLEPITKPGRKLSAEDWARWLGAH